MRKPPAKSALRKAALTKIDLFFSEAAAAFKKNPEISDDKVRLARRTAQKARTSIPARFKKSFCKNCDSYWVPGKSVRVRLQKQKVVYYCLFCKHHTRHPYVREKKDSRKQRRSPSSAAV